MPRRIRYVGPLAALLLALTACGDDDSGPGTSPTASPTAAASPTTSDSASTATPSESASESAGGTAEDPTLVTASTDLLAWKALPGSVDDTVTTNGEWTLTINKQGDEAQLEGPGSASGSGATDERITDAFLDEDHAVLVHQDRQEIRPSRAEVTDLETGRTFWIDGESDVPTTNGGTWALGEGRLLHATVTDEGSYCLVSVDLGTRTSTLGWCAPKRHGFNGARITPAGDSLMTFDDSQPSCRTLAAVRTDVLEPFPGVPECQGWDGLLTEGGAVWSVVPKANQVEAAHFYARAGDSYLDLGPGTSGTLTWCSGATYWVRDPQLDGEPARLMRYDDRGLAVVYESPGGEAFLSSPRCGGDTMNITALTESGDEQVSAYLG